jgi:CDP-diacylglycerol--glycerol-3-phosphate 3-phosphatidyltransferase
MLKRRHVPNLLSLFRLGMVPALGALAWTGHAVLFLSGLVAALGSDVLDGWLARRSGVTSPTGAKLDSWGDLATYATLPLFVWWLWPDLVRAELPWLACALVAYALPIAAGFARFGRLTSYHTWAAKGTAWVMGSALFALFVGGPAWPFHVAVVLLAAEAIEEILITCVLPAFRTDVPSIWHAVQAR